MIKNKKKLKSVLFNVLAILLFTVGLVLSLYPTVSDIYGKYRDSKLIAKYENAIDDMSKQEKTDYLAKAVDYNNNLYDKANGFLVTKYQHEDIVEENDPEEYETYENMLKNSSSRIMCTISIPKIAVTLPVYHWSTDSVLEKGIGHIHGSSLPVGNGVDPEDPEFANIAGSHSLFIGHRGLPSLKLFSDLDEMEEGDMFYIKTLGKTYAYKIYDVETVLPTEVENLKIEPGKDLCTLITCTPYGVNTHRILVKGERVPYDGESIEADTLTMIKKTVDPKTVFGICFIIFIIYLFVINKKPKKQKGNTGDQHDEEKTSSNGS